MLVVVMVEECGRRRQQEKGMRISGGSVKQAQGKVLISRSGTGTATTVPGRAPTGRVCTETVPALLRSS